MGGAGAGVGIDVGGWAPGNIVSGIRPALPIVPGTGWAQADAATTICVADRRRTRREAVMESITCRRGGRVKHDHPATTFV